MALFDAYLTVDWSAAAVPTTGADSIWLHLGVRRGSRLETRHLSNPATRGAAIAEIGRLMSDCRDAGRRLLAGFDFPFGYPAGAAAAFETDPADWRGMWRLLADRLRDDDDNGNDRFLVAEALNRRFPVGTGPFWGRPDSLDLADLPARKPRAAALPERRRADRRAGNAQPVWKLYTTGSVGSQALTGIARLERLRRDPDLGKSIQVWPFETGLRPPVDQAPIIVAEVYPSLVAPTRLAGLPKDAGQVVAIGRHLARRDRDGDLARDLAGPADLTAEDRRAIETEEAWILGAGTFEPDLATPRDPDGIYALSWARVRSATDLSVLPDALHPIAIRLVHTGADPSLMDDLAASTDAVASAKAALAAGRPILVDARMVEAGITRAWFATGNRVICTLTPDVAAPADTTRSAAAVDLWTDTDLEGAVVAIGNAPTALERLLDRVAQGGPRPAVILGFCVGFVGAAEAKARLMAQRRVPWIALAGRRGGSALAAAAVNALAAPPP